MSILSLMYKDITNDVELLILIDISTAHRLKHEEICKIVKTHRLKYSCQHNLEVIGRAKMPVRIPTMRGYC